MQKITREEIENEFENDSTPKKPNEQEKKKGSFDEKNYLDVKLKKGEKSKEKVIRFLPIDGTSKKFFKIIHTHTLKVDKQIAPKEWKGYICLKQNDDIDHETLGNKCPICELNYEAYKKSLEATDPNEKKRWQEISLAHKSQETIVCRCIERGAEEDGPKFLKFNMHKKKDDIYNVVKKLYYTRRNESIEAELEARGLVFNEENTKALLEEGFEPDNIFDIYNGKDFILTITAEIDENGEATGKTSLTITDKSRMTPLSRNEENIEKWVNDKKKWSDVFVAKPYEYLSIILDGKIPYFDRNNGVWVEKDLDEKPQKNTRDSEEIEKQAKEAEKAVLKRSDDSLPFGED